MGAPKLKWTSEEEAALKAGISKYGTGKWSTILKDTQFSSVLHSRSNVDLKDKWRNMNVANGLGSRNKARVSVRNNQQIVKDERDAMALSTVVLSDQEVVDAMPLAMSDGTLENGCPKKPMSRLDDLILEAITNLKEPRGSSRAAIAMFIEEQYSTPRNLDRLLADSLKLLIEDGKLMKVKHLYRILPKSAVNEKKDPAPLLLEGIPNGSPNIEKNETQILTKSQIDEFLEKMKDMTPQEAAVVAAQAVAEAEAAIAAAEEAAWEAEQAEAEAEAAQVFAEAARKALMKTPVYW